MKEVPIPFQPPLAGQVHRDEKLQTRRLRLICQPGDRLWVREAWRVDMTFDKVPPRDLPRGMAVHYEGDGAAPVGFGKLRPPMFMCRWMSRTLLEVTDVFAHQLQTIDRLEAIAEGCDGTDHLRGDDDLAVADAMAAAERAARSLLPIPWAVARFAVLWDSINGQTEGANWAANPWVWAYTFHRVKP